MVVWLAVYWMASYVFSGLGLMFIPATTQRRRNVLGDGVLGSQRRKGTELRS
jgi:hypothetical protein